MRRETYGMDARWLERLLAVALVIGAMVALSACAGGDDQEAEVGADRAASDDDGAEAGQSDGGSAPESGDDAESDDDAGSDDEEDAGSSVAAFEESGAEGALGDQMEALADEITCAPVDDETETVSIGPKWATDMAYDVVVFEGPTDPTENKFSVSVLDPGFSAATLEWIHDGAIVDGEADLTDRLPTIAYYVSPEGQIDGLANSDQVREEAIAINAGLADEVSEEAAEQGRAMIEGLPDEALIALYASREVFFHSLDGYVLSNAESREFETTQPDAGGFGIEVPATIETKIETMANDAGCVVITQVTEANREELAEVLDQGPVAGEDFDVDSFPTFSSALTAWVDGTTGEVRRLSRRETQNANGEAITLSMFDLFALDAAE